MIKRLLYIIAVISLFTSCDFHTLDNGDLDGFWFLTDVDSLEENKSVDYRQERICWSIQGNLIETSKFNKQTGDKELESYIFRFDSDGSKFNVFSPYIYDRKNGDRPMSEENLYLLEPYGINSLAEEFTIETITNSRLVLANDLLRLHFEKY